MTNINPNQKFQLSAGSAAHFQSSFLYQRSVCLVGTIYLHILKTLQKENKRVFIHCIMNYRVSAFMYQYKKSVLKQTNAKLIAPEGFKPKKIWKKLMQTELTV